MRECVGVLLIMGAAAFANPAAAVSAVGGGRPCPLHTTFEVGLPGATLCTVLEDPEHALQQSLMREWIDRSARIVADYYAGFPAPLVTLRIHATAGGGVHGGRTTNESGLVIQLSVGRDVSRSELREDWVLVHEMVHLALPELGRGHNWLAEGLATYVEGIARAQSGNRAIADVWAEYARSMPMGLPRAGEGGMDETPTWGRTYWGGALYCLQADVGIREQTANRVGLQTALRAILRATGGYRVERSIDAVLTIGDAATGTRVLQDLYRQIQTTPVTPDLALLWSRLGVPNDPLTQPFEEHAPLAALRIAITRKP